VTRGPRGLRVGVAELLGHPGERRRFHTSVPFDDLRLSAAWVDAGDDVDVDLVLEAVLGGRLTVTGAVRAPWSGECRRCLGTVQGDLAVEVRDVFTEEGSDDAGDPDLLTFRGAEIDLEPVVREAVLLSLPIAPLCRDDCAGPAPERAPVSNPDEAASPDELAPVRDPRWAALDELRFDE
jgi:uncharacterized protein